MESQLNEVEQMFGRMDEMLNDCLSSNSGGNAPAFEDEQPCDGVKRSRPEMLPSPKLSEIVRCDRRVVKRVLRPALATGKQGNVMPFLPHQSPRNLGACA